MLRIVQPLGLALALFASIPQAALAQEEGGEQLDEAARITFEQARQEFVNGNYERALALFRQAYSLSPRAGLLYNIAQTLDRLRRDEETLQALRDYREAAPDAPNIAEVEARIRVLEREVERNNNDNNNGGGNTTPATDDGGLAILHPAIFIAGAALTLGSAGVLIWSGLETMSLNDFYNEAQTRAEAEARFGPANDQQVLTNAFIAVTGVLAAATVVCLIFTDWNAFGGGESAGNSVRPVVLAGPGGALLGLESTF
jgi:tetratricopeptide (TPR) repeat protein